MRPQGISANEACDHIRKRAAEACDEWESLMNEDPEAPAYLYWREPNKKQRVGRLKVANENPKRGWKLVAEMMLSPRWTREETHYFVLERMLYLPILRGPIKQ